MEEERDRNCDEAPEGFKCSWPADRILSSFSSMPTHWIVTFEPGIAAGELVHRLPREPMQSWRACNEREAQVVQNISVEKNLSKRQNWSHD